MHFTLKQLRYVEATGRLGSIANAAAELNISQSSIAAAIGSLERQIGFDLFVRTPAKGIVVTPAGRETLQLIQEFIVKNRIFESEVASIGGASTGTVRISCYTSPSFLPPILKNFRSRCPNASVVLLEGNMEETLASLVNGEADIAFSYDEMAGDHQNFVPLVEAPPYALMAADDPLAHRKSVCLAELAEHPMVMLDMPQTRKYFVGLFESHGLAPILAHSTQSAEMAWALVASGYGYSILNICPPEYQRDDARFRAVPIQDGLRPPVFGMITQTGVRQPKMVTTFIKQCVDLKKSGGFENIVVSAD